MALTFAEEREIHKAEQRVISKIWELSLNPPENFCALKDSLYGLANLVRKEMRLKNGNT